MKVFLCTGKAAKSMEKVMREQFTGFMQVISGSALEDIDKSFVLGNVFERILITEAAWTIDGRITEEWEIRKRINDLSIRSARRGGQEQYVFLTRSFDQAEICADETSEIRDRCVIVLYQGVGSAAVIGEMLDRDITFLRDDLKHKYAEITIETDVEVDVDVSNINLPESEKRTIKTGTKVVHTTGSQAIRNVQKTPWFSDKDTAAGFSDGFGNADFDANINYDECETDLNIYEETDDGFGYQGNSIYYPNNTSSKKLQSNAARNISFL